MHPKLIISGDTFRLPLPGENIEPLETEVCLLKAGFTVSDKPDKAPEIYIQLGLKGLFFRNYGGTYSGQVLSLKCENLFNDLYNDIMEMSARQADSRCPIYFTIGIDPESKPKV